MDGEIQDFILMYLERFDRISIDDAAEILVLAIRQNVESNELTRLTHIEEQLFEIERKLSGL